MLPDVTLEDREKALERYNWLTEQINKTNLTKEELQERLNGLTQKYCEERFNLIGEYGITYQYETDSWRLMTEKEYDYYLESKKPKGKEFNFFNLSGGWR